MMSNQRGLLGSTRVALTILAVGLVSLLSCAALGQTFSVLHAFTGNHDGGAPFGGVAVDKHGNVFGTASGGGQYGQGVLFELNSAGQELVLHSFFHTEGSQPWATPLLAANGSIYGTTYTAGYVTGTAWEYFKGGKLRVLHKFSTYPSDGGNPMVGVVRDQAGNLYDTTPYGGGHGHGTVFKITSAGVESDLYSFFGPPDGDSPSGGVIVGTDGSLYGATVIGGAMGYGVVYKVDTKGRETVLHTFTLVDGDMPIGGLATDNEGNLYGTTFLGGTFGTGEVFKLDGGGNLTLLYSFGGTLDDALHPFAGVTRDQNGNLYGTTSEGGPYGAGAVFKLTLDGTYTILHYFTGGSDGGGPYAGVALDTSGNVYGTTLGGGQTLCSCGVVFKITP